MERNPVRPAYLCLLALTATVLTTTPAHANFTNVTASADTFILASAPDNNAGAHSHVTAGRDAAGGSGVIRRGLYQFDLSGIPPGATITSAVLEIQVVGLPLGPADSTFDVVPITAAWTEGQQPSSGANSGSPAATGECTWNSRHHDLATWTSPGADVSPTPLASTFISGFGTYSWSAPGLLATVADWVSAPAGNHGLLLRSQAEGITKTVRQFGSREGGSPAVLRVGFLTPPPPAFTAITITPTNLLSLAWTSSPNRRYDVLYADNLLPSQTWHLAEADIPAAPLGTNTWTNPPLLAGPLLPSTTNRFYTLRELPAAPPGLPIQLQIVASNLTAPTAIAHAHDASGRLFIAEQLGQIRILDAALNLLPTPFLDIAPAMTNLAHPFGGATPGLNPAYDERGLLGLAFHPNYAANGRFFIFYNAPKSGPGIHCESRLSEFHVSPTNANLALPASEQILLRFDKPEFNHNGGDITFGPDGYLYIPVGDGGGAGDQHPPFGNAQSLTNLLGKILRIDVNGAPPYAIPPDNPLVGLPGARPEIFAWGLRNPWKVAFDTTNLWVADVGQDRFEEIDWVRNGGNYGWRITEGRHAFDLNTASLAATNVLDLDAPIHAYPHGPLGISIIGGFVYRGAAYPALQGRYVFGDFGTSFAFPDGALYYLEESRPGIWQRFDFTLPTTNRLGRFVKTFGQGPDGELYLGSTLSLGPSGTSGDIRKLLPPP